MALGLSRVSMHPRVNTRLYIYISIFIKSCIQVMVVCFFKIRGVVSRVKMPGLHVCDDVLLCFWKFFFM